MSTHPAGVPEIRFPAFWNWSDGRRAGTGLTLLGGGLAALLVCLLMALATTVDLSFLQPTASPLARAELWIWAGGLAFVITVLVCGLLMGLDEASSPATRRAMVAGGLLINLAVLAHQVHRAFGQGEAVAALVLTPTALVLVLWGMSLQPRYLAGLPDPVTRLLFLFFHDAPEHLVGLVNQRIDREGGRWIRKLIRKEETDLLVVTLKTISTAQLERLDQGLLKELLLHERAEIRQAALRALGQTRRQKNL